MTPTKRLTEARNLDKKDIVFGDITSHVAKKSDVSYQRIPITYNNGPLLLKTPKCWTNGVLSTEMENGSTRHTLPLVFNNPPTPSQEEWLKAFEIITQCAFQHLVSRGFSAHRLERLDSCIWEDKVLYAGIVESHFYNDLSSRYFIDGKEVAKEAVNVGFDAVAAIRVDSIYMGEKTISLQVRLYEVSLTPTKKRDRIL